VPKKQASRGWARQLLPVSTLSPHSPQPHPPHHQLAHFTSSYLCHVINHHRLISQPGTPLNQQINLTIKSKSQCQSVEQQSTIRRSFTILNIRVYACELIRPVLHQVPTARAGPNLAIAQVQHRVQQCNLPYYDRTLDVSNHCRTPRLTWSTAPQSRWILRAQAQAQLLSRTWQPIDRTRIITQPVVFKQPVTGLGLVGATKVCPPNQFHHLGDCCETRSRVCNMTTISPVPTTTEV
jgi:hypothetical protein